ncbi:MAG: hypothetical protein J6Q08_01085 [Bacteroidaceae bacterium]|nr:hypothetical protein [Bacteroidaceae bacterium]
MPTREEVEEMMIYCSIEVKGTWDPHPPYAYIVAQNGRSIILLANTPTYAYLGTQNYNGGKSTNHRWTGNLSPLDNTEAIYHLCDMKVADNTDLSRESSLWSRQVCDY